MALNNQYDENAADLRNIETISRVTTQAGDTSVSSATPSAPASTPTPHNVTKMEIALVIGILLAVLGIVYFILQPSNKNTYGPLGPQPLPGAWNYPGGKNPTSVK